MSSSDESSAKMAMLMEMGFDAEKVQQALEACQGNVERAIDFLFSAPTEPSTHSSGVAASAPNAGADADAVTEDITSSISQYSFDQGRSACTCIALTAAMRFLTLSSITSELTPQFLQEVITQGIETYEGLKSASSSSAEHMSAEEVLAIGHQKFGSLQLIPGGIRQGILSTSPNNEMGLKALLLACQNDAPKVSQDSYLAVLITKTPETVLLCLPTSIDASNKHPYVIIDSHPRPGVVNSDGGSYARLTPSLEAAVVHLETIFPATELGPDIPEMYAMMYNSFDLYPLILK